MIGRSILNCRKQVLALALGLGFIGLTFPGNLAAQRSDKETIVTFNAPIEIPGSNPQVLPAGTYLFKLVDSKSDPHVVQVSNKEESQVYSTILTIPAHRDAATSKTVMTFKERASGQPQAIERWFYPNDTVGEEFVYPPATPQPALAKTTPAAPSAAPAAVETPRPEAATNNSAPAEPAPPPPQVATASPAPAPAPITPAPAETAPPQAAAAPPPQAPEPPASLPHTAGNVPELMLIGLMSLGGGLVIRRLRVH